MKLGVVGTLVWDSIIPFGQTRATDEWGGIAYSLAALDVALESTCSICPIFKVGKDLEGEAREYLQGFARVDVDSLCTDDLPNNRVELTYTDALERVEVLSGGVSPWGLAELCDRVADCQALYVNFISGFEMSIVTARELREVFPGPIYADLHSLFLGIDNHGRRFPRAPETATEWFGLFDCVQMNRAEADLLKGAGGSTDAPGPAATFVTDGPAGVAFTCVGGLLESPVRWPTPGGATVRPQGGHVGSSPTVNVVDPTGCGDVWGGACFAALLGGANVPTAVAGASRFAEAALAVRGAPRVHSALAALDKNRDAAS